MTGELSLDQLTLLKDAPFANERTCIYGKSETPVIALRAWSDGIVASTYGLRPVIRGKNARPALQLLQSPFVGLPASHLPDRSIDLGALICDAAAPERLLWILSESYAVHSPATMRGSFGRFDETAVLVAGAMRKTLSYLLIHDKSQWLSGGWQQTEGVPLALRLAIDWFRPTCRHQVFQTSVPKKSASAAAIAANADAVRKRMSRNGSLLYSEPRSRITEDPHLTAHQRCDAMERIEAFLHEAATDLELGGASLLDAMDEISRGGSAKE